MASSYLEDKNFVEFVLEKGSIPFLVRGSISCLHNFNFTPILGVRISGPTYHVRVFGENVKKPDETAKVHVQELIDEVVFPGEIELPERNVKGISKALYGLELWADFLCLAVGNPKLRVEIQRPINVVIAFQSEFDAPALDRWANLIQAHFQLGSDERRRLAGALWWYRKGCAAAYYSLFDSYTAYWNCLEIMCGVSGSQAKKGPEVDKLIQDYLRNKEITAGQILHCYNNFVNYSIREQMKDALKTMIGNEQASQVIYHCFETKPDAERLYQIRNDINHGNIQENSREDYLRVRYRGELLHHIVMKTIHHELGHPISIGMSINELAEKIDPDRRTEQP